MLPESTVQPDEEESMCTECSLSLMQIESVFAVAMQKASVAQFDAMLCLTILLVI